MECEMHNEQVPNYNSPTNPIKSLISSTWYHSISKKCDHVMGYGISSTNFILLSTVPDHSVSETRVAPKFHLTIPIMLIGVTSVILFYRIKFGQCKYCV